MARKLTHYDKVAVMKLVCNHSETRHDIPTPKELSRRVDRMLVEYIKKSIEEQFRQCKQDKRRGYYSDEDEECGRSLPPEDIHLQFPTYKHASRAYHLCLMCGYSNDSMSEIREYNKKGNTEIYVDGRQADNKVFGFDIDIWI